MLQIKTSLTIFIHFVVFWYNKNQRLSRACAAFPVLRVYSTGIMLNTEQQFESTK
jgi:hypothetical protein